MAGAAHLVLLFVASASATCDSWCNAYTCGLDAHCDTCPDCTSLNAGTYCSPWCNAWTTSMAHCSGCVVTAEVNAGTHCASWCNSYTCGMSSCEACSVCSTLSCGNTCASYCNPFTCFLQHCAGCDSCQSPMPLAGDVSGLPTCGATWPSTPPATYSSVLSAENSITAITAMIPGDVSLFATNCGASGVVVQPMAATSVVTGDAFGAVSIGTRVTAGGTPPGGLHTFNQGANYFWTADGATQNPNPTFATYSPCNYNGALAYCSGHQLGYDYDYGVASVGQDRRTYCVSFEESTYCDGAANARMYTWQVRFDSSSEVGQEIGAYSSAPNPYTSPPTPATFACKTDALMPDGLGLSYVPAAGSSSSTTSASLEGCSLCHCGATASGQSAAGCI